ncbi:MAG TPA: flagellar assembly protein FliH [Spirochaetales bacterium]|nr:flagellar assembly protein FliH [Spirochaetales bacterium]MBP7262708.1 flagellar assembly protein FliH [Spirochaetia bacterium]HPE35960.1 flagellar assembly protein FliH [Spirochaetales bacterium]
MAKTVFRPQEIVPLSSAFVLSTPGSSQAAQEVEEAVAVPEYQGPTADDLRREAELFKEHWEQEKEAMIASARAEAQGIITQAEATAFEEVKRKNDQALKIRQEAEDAAEKAVKDAEGKIQALEAEARSRVDEVTKEAYKKGWDQGREDGYKEGRNEVERLIGRLHVILERAMDKRAEILEQTEGQIVELVLLIARKVVKTISENQKNVVISNIAQALRKLKTRSDVIIKVNLADLQLASDHSKDFVEMAENAKRLTVVEDSSIDRGGCVIETDFGEIDARIQSQLHELEEKILDISPIKARGKVQ